ncbi:LacI family transcriptional regulator [Streptomyces sp. NBC_01725]|uniref:LacI family DNA-binding transcriptional regulator n=1 Tax=unclassified Streptomyces TaxID=2593676 RepID=UPI001650A830|nr:MULTISPECIES: LacI family DNA-binding transcriptional regulator [unclassified Streptomyces]
MNGPERPRKRPTQADVARLAKVSAAVVSAVVNGRTSGGVRVGDRTAARVEEAIQQLGYVPNVAARNLAGGRSNIIGVFTYEALFPMDAMSFYHPFLMGVEEAVENLDCHLLLFTGSHVDGRRRAIYKNGVNTLQLADGAVIVGQAEDRDELTALLREGFPAVFIGRRELTSIEASYAAADYNTATRQLVERISGLGHRRIARLHSGSGHESIVDRDAGFIAARALLADRLDAADVFITPNAAAVTELVPRLVEQGYTCLVADDCDRAGDACAAAEELGLSVPRDLSIAALSEFSFTAPHRDFTTVVTPGREMGAAAVRLLADILANPSDRTPRRIVVDCATRDGDTLAPPRG